MDIYRSHTGHIHFFTGHTTGHTVWPLSWSDRPARSQGPLLRPLPVTRFGVCTSHISRPAKPVVAHSHLECEVEPTPVAIACTAEQTRSRGRRIWGIRDEQAAPPLCALAIRNCSPHFFSDLLMLKNLQKIPITCILVLACHDKGCQDTCRNTEF